MSRVELTPGVPPHQPLTAVELANYLGIGLGIVVLALVLYTAIFYRERLLDPTAKECKSPSYGARSLHGFGRSPASCPEDL